MVGALASGPARLVAHSQLGPIYQQRIPLAYLVYIYGGAHSLPIAVATQFVALTTDFLEGGEAFLVNQG